MRNEKLRRGKENPVINNPLDFVQMMVYSGDVFIEFRTFQSANQTTGIYNAMLWADRVFNHYGIKKPRYGKDWRVWIKIPTDAERSAVPWEE